MSPDTINAHLKRVREAQHPVTGRATASVHELDIYRCSVYSARMTRPRAMQEASFLILTALAGDSQHGYGIVTDVKQISDGRGKLRAGTLYAALDRLTTDGLIEPDREEIVDNRLRRYYRITGAGAQRLTEEADR